MNLDVSDSITWLGEGWCENAGEKNKNSLLSLMYNSPSLLCKIACWNFKNCVYFSRNEVVVCLTAPVMLPNSQGAPRNALCQEGLQPWALVGDVRPVRSVMGTE